MSIAANTLTTDELEAIYADGITTETDPDVTLPNGMTIPGFTRVIGMSDDAKRASELLSEIRYGTKIINYDRTRPRRVVELVLWYDRPAGR